MSTPPVSFPTSTANRVVAFAFVEAVNSNPNGDPDNSGRPRMTLRGYGEVSEQSYKRKIRDMAQEYLDQILYIEPGHDLGEKQASAASPTEAKRKWWDLRLFGGILTASMKKDKSKAKGEDEEKVERSDAAIRGAVQISDGISLNPVVVREVSLTRCATHNTDGNDANMGSRSKVEFGLYKHLIQISPKDLARHGATSDDLNIFWQCATECHEHARASNRMGVNVRRVVMFVHPNARGVESTLRSEKRVKVTTEGGATPASYDDYTFDLDLTNVPAGMKVYSWEDGDLQVLA
jgi:CRISPR-associated protein Csd2